MNYGNITDSNKVSKELKDKIDKRLDFQQRLNKLFSRPSVIRQVISKTGETKLVHIRDIDAMPKSKFSSLTGKTWERLRRGSMGLASFGAELTPGLRKLLYAEYNSMELSPEIAVSLDIYADESTTLSEKGEILCISSSDQNIKLILESLFYDILNVNYNLWVWVRNMCKYGDYGLALVVEEDQGIIDYLPIAPWLFEREEGIRDDQEGTKILFKIEGLQKPLKNYEFAHFRLLGDPQFLPWGRSIIEPARTIWKQMTLLEDAMLVYRITRAPDRRIYYIDVGSLPPDEVDQYMEKVKLALKSDKYVDPTTGKFDYRFSSMNMLEDIFVPVSGDKQGTKIEILQGGGNEGNIEDVEYLHKKLLSALKIPGAFLGFEEDLCLTSDTEILVLDGSFGYLNLISLTIKELSQLSDLSLYLVYSKNENGETVIGRIEKVWKTIENAEIWEVTINKPILTYANTPIDYERIKCTGNHPFMLKGGSYKRADELEVGELLESITFHKFDPENYLVLSVKKLEKREDVYDLCIKDYHNFALSAGVFVHNSGKSTLSAEDVRFSRTINRVQQVIIDELRKIATIHLVSLGFSDNDLVNFDLELTPSSAISIQQRLDLMNAKIEAFNNAVAGGFSYRWAYEHIYNIEGEEFDEIAKERLEDAKFRYRLASIEEQGHDPVAEVEIDQQMMEDKFEETGEEESIPFFDEEEAEALAKEEEEEPKERETAMSSTEEITNDLNDVGQRDLKNVAGKEHKPTSLLKLDNRPIRARKNMRKSERKVLEELRKEKSNTNKITEANIQRIKFNAAHTYESRTEEDRDLDKLAVLVQKEFNEIVKEKKKTK